jgi:hypothetical protein
VEVHAKRTHVRGRAGDRRLALRRMPLRWSIYLLGPGLLKIKVLKEMRQRLAASQSGRLIGGKATAFDLHAHRFAASHNSPPPRRRISGLAGRPNVIAPVVFDHSKLPIFPSAIAFNVSLLERGLGITLSVMSKYDRPSMIMLAVNAGLPLVSLVAVVALIVRQMVPV